MKRHLPLLVLVPFTVFSTWVAVTAGLSGVDRALHEPWALQFLVDLSIAISCISIWVWKDARARGIAPLPYVVAMVFLGSIGVLAYFVRRTYGAAPTPAPALAPNRA